MRGALCMPLIRAVSSEVACFLCVKVSSGSKFTFAIVMPPNHKPAEFYVNCQYDMDREVRSKRM